MICSTMRTRLEDALSYDKKKLSWELIKMEALKIYQQFHGQVELSESFANGDRLDFDKILEVLKFMMFTSVTFLVLNYLL